MSATARRPPVAPPPSPRPVRPPRPPAPDPRAEWTWFVPRVITFAALAGWAVLRWVTLLDPRPVAAGLGLVLIALLAAISLRAFSRARPAVALPAGAGVAVLWIVTAALVSGTPASTLNPRHWGTLADGLQDGLNQLPRLLVPYEQPDPWPRIVIMLGGALLLIAAALLATVAKRGGDGRRMLAAIPLVAMTVVPATIIPQHDPFAQGAVLFALLAASIWLERLPRGDLPLAVGAVVLAGAAGLLVGPQLHGAKPWIDAQKLVNGLDRPDPSRFDWTQRYGPLDWPRDGSRVMTVSSNVPLYWKTENLDGFDGLAWYQQPSESATNPAQEIPPAAFANPAWHHDIRVQLGAMSSNDVVGAGTTLGLTGVDDAQPGESPGTWTVPSALTKGRTYVAHVFAAEPNPQQMQDAGTDYPRAMLQYMELRMPRRGVAGTWTNQGGTVPFAPFGSAVQPPAPPDLAESPYARAYALANRLSTGAPTPYAFVERVLGYLGNGFVYDESPPQRAVPLEDFLFRDRAGYCQQFAGAAALLLRMGGVPARVATGFTTGSRATRSDDYVVRDFDAHAWVEVWFPHYGWVSFDPTPGSAPALSAPDTRAAAIAARAPAITPPTRFPAPRRDTLGETPASGPVAAVTHGGGTPWGWIVAGVLAAGAAAGLLIRRRLRRPAAAADRLLAELEGALRRTRRAPEPGITLHELEHRFRATPEAAAYVRTLRLARYAGGDPHVTPHQRRALRIELGRGLGFVGWLRALLALPPRLR